MKKSLLLGMFLVVCVVIVTFVFAQFYPEGMISYWKFEGSGITASDSVDANDGTIYGATRTTGIVGDALSFNGMGDYVELPASNSILTDSPFTISAWIITDVQQGDYGPGEGRIVNLHREVAYSTSASIYAGGPAGGEPGDRDDICFLYWTGTAHKWLCYQTNSPVYHDGNPHLITATHDGSTVKLYYDGEEVRTRDDDFGTFGTATAKIGSFNGSERYFNGVIDEVAIYDRALTAEEIRWHYEYGLIGLGYDVECVPSGMVSWWDGDAISGMTALDIQDGNNGTMVGGASTITSGKVDGAFSFDGFDDYVEIQDSDSLDTGTQFTIDAWFNTDDVDKIDPGTGYPIQTIVMYGFDPAYGKNNPLSIRDGKLSFVIRGYGSGFEDLVGTTLVNNDTWYHAAVTYDGTTAKLYLNGALEDSEISSMNMNTNSRVTIGRYQNPSNFGIFFHFDGLIDEVEIFNRALPLSEIQAIYNADSAGKCKEVVIKVKIDIKPGSYPNCFNSNEHGVIPVAILGSADFDVTEIDPLTVTLDGQLVRVKGKSGNAGSFKFVNDDEFMDLVVQITDEGAYSVGDSIGIITAVTYEGDLIIGKDTICITQD